MQASYAVTRDGEAETTETRRLAAVAVVVLSCPLFNLGQCYQIW